MALSNGALAPLNGHAVANGFSPTGRELDTLANAPAEVQAVINSAGAPAKRKGKAARKQRFNAQGDPMPPVPAPRNPFNALQQSELEITERVCAAAKRVDHAPMLQKWDVSGVEVDALLAAVRDARNIATSAQSSTNARKDATGEGDRAKSALCELFRVVQSAARKAFAAQRPNHLNDYGIGLAPDSRSRIEQIYHGILTQLETDTPPGIDADWIQTLRDAYATWKAPQSDQTGAQVDATNGRFQRDTLVSDILARRRAIQIAANGLWPPRPENAGVRREFSLSPDRNFAPNI